MKIKFDVKSLELELNDSDKEFISKIAQHNLFGMLGDQIAKWRWQNAIRIISKANKIAASHNVSLNSIPSKFLQQFIEASSLEENEDLQNMWANLLINKSVDGQVNIHYINILKSIEPFEARLLQKIYDQSKSSTDTIFSFQAIIDSSGVNDIDLKVVIHKLYSFNVLRPPLMQGISVGGPSGAHSPAVETTDAFRFSEMGLDFCKKCNGIDEE